jgi:hypothetical protein
MRDTHVAPTFTTAHLPATVSRYVTSRSFTQNSDCLFFTDAGFTGQNSPGMYA